VLNWNLKEDEGNRLKVHASAGQVVASIVCNSKVTLLGEFLKSGTTAICADVKGVNATNSKDSANRDAEHSHHRP
jgi:hypothetical protein